MTWLLMSCMLSLTTTRPATPGTFKSTFWGSFRELDPGLCQILAVWGKEVWFRTFPPPFLLYRQVLPDPQFANQRKRIKLNPALTQLVFMRVLFARKVFCAPVLLRHYSDLFMVVSQVWHWLLICTALSDTALPHFCCRRRNKSTNHSRDWREALPTGSCGFCSLHYHIIKDKTLSNLICLMRIWCISKVPEIWWM